MKLEILAVARVELVSEWLPSVGVCQQHRVLPRDLVQEFIVLSVFRPGVLHTWGGRGLCAAKPVFKYFLLFPTGIVVPTAQTSGQASTPQPAPAAAWAQSAAGSRSRLGGVGDDGAATKAGGDGSQRHALAAARRVHNVQNAQISQNPKLPRTDGTLALAAPPCEPPPPQLPVGTSGPYQRCTTRFPFASHVQTNKDTNLCLRCNMQCPAPATSTQSCVLECLHSDCVCKTSRLCLETARKPCSGCPSATAACAALRRSLPQRCCYPGVMLLILGRMSRRKGWQGPIPCIGDVTNRPLTVRSPPFAVVVAIPNFLGLLSAFTCRSWAAHGTAAFWTPSCRQARR